MSGSAVVVTRGQVVAFRVARHGMVERLGRDGVQAAAVVGLQDTPPGTAALALAARADVAPEALDELVLVPSVRGAPLAVAERDLGVFTAGLEPPDEEAAKAVVGNAWKSLDASSQSISTAPRHENRLDLTTILRREQHHRQRSSRSTAARKARPSPTTRRTSAEHQSRRSVCIKKSAYRSCR